MNSLSLAVWKIPTVGALKVASVVTWTTLSTPLCLHSTARRADTAPIQTGVQVCGDNTSRTCRCSPRVPAYLTIKINSTGNGMQILSGTKKLTPGKNDGGEVDTYFQF